MNVTRVPLASLVPDPANARLHGDRNLDAITASLRRFGQAEPLVVQAGTGRVIAGHGRLLAMRQLGWAECDVVQLAVDDLQATSLAIALNRTGDLSTFDEPVLARLLEQLRAQDAIDGLGYSTAEIDELLKQVGAAGFGPGEVDDHGPEPPPETPTSRRGDLWILGNHRLLCGDSTNPEDVSRVLGGEKAALFSSDPPYCVDYTGDDRPQDSGKDWSGAYREIDIKDLGEFLRATFRAVLPRLAEDAAIYVWHAHLQYPVIDRVFEEFGILRHQPIIWKKPSSTFTYSYYRWAHEPCLMGWKQGHKPPHYLENGMTSVWEVDWEGKARITTFHPTCKPVRLFEIPMEQHTRAGAVVFEPFNGSGSQIIAAEKLGRRCCAIEIAPAFIDGTIARWEKATGKEAVLEGTVKTFRAVADERKVDTVERPNAETPLASA